MLVLRSNWFFLFWVICSFSPSLLVGYGPVLDPELALKRLMDGNYRFVKDKLIHPDRSSDRREASAQKQMPFGVVVGCSDSRIPPEIIFDQGIGDLFVIRVAGHVVGPIELDSILFSVKYNGSSIILVLGHESCGAVQAVLEKKIEGIPSVASLIDHSLQPLSSPLDLEKAVKSHVKATCLLLRKHPVIKDYLEKGELHVIGGYYQFESGKVEFFD